MGSHSSALRWKRSRIDGPVVCSQRGASSGACFRGEGSSPVDLKAPALGARTGAFDNAPRDANLRRKRSGAGSGAKGQRVGQFRCLGWIPEGRPFREGRKRSQGCWLLLVAQPRESQASSSQAPAASAGDMESFGSEDTGMEWAAEGVGKPVEGACALQRLSFASRGACVYPAVAWSPWPD